ncbi:MAG: fibrinogen-like YCDxxxxGGGW domain-containing protein, partial [Candidatus Woesearchaeota archaeon]
MKRGIIFLVVIVFLASVGNVYAAIGDNPSESGRSCAEIYWGRPYSFSKTYWVDPDPVNDPEPFQVYCDMEIDNDEDGHPDGWMLVMAYHHEAEVSLDIFPVDGPSSGTFPLKPIEDVSGPPSNLHVDNLQAWGFSVSDIDEVMMYCDSTGNDGRIFNYKTNNFNVINSILDNTQLLPVCDDFKDGDPLSDPPHDTTLPDSCTFSIETNSDYIFGYEFPMRDGKSGALHNWVLDGTEGITFPANRWECDDKSIDDDEFDTHHRIYVRDIIENVIDYCVIGDPDDPPTGPPYFYETKIYLDSLDYYNAQVGLQITDKEIFCPAITGNQIFVQDIIGGGNIAIMDINCRGANEYTNCHAYEEGTFGEKTLYFGKSSSFDGICYLTEPDEPCVENDMCILRLSSLANAHVASCDPAQYGGSDYRYLLCCEYTPLSGEECGDGRITGGEQCDCGYPWYCDTPEELDFKTCQDFDYPPGGELFCDPFNYCRFSLPGTCNEWIDPNSYYDIGECYCPNDSPDGCADGVGEQLKTKYIRDYTLDPP